MSHGSSGSLFRLRSPQNSQQSLRGAWRASPTGFVERCNIRFEGPRRDGGVDGRAHFIAGGGAGLQWAHTDVDDPPFRIDRTETIRLLHGRIGAEWDISSRMAIRTEGVVWFGEGLDWVLGARAGLGYRF